MQKTDRLAKLVVALAKLLWLLLLLLLLLLMFLNLFMIVVSLIILGLFTLVSITKSLLPKIFQGVFFNPSGYFRENYSNHKDYKGRLSGLAK
jgi:hypothetical protein